MSVREAGDGMVIIPEIPDENALEAKCPAARMGNYADSGNRYILCAVERRHFAVKDGPTAALTFCCNEEGYTDCPTWQAAKDGDAVVERTHAAQDRAEQEAITRRQIIQGVRVDDRGMAEEAYEEEVQAAARRELGKRTE